MHHQGGPAFNSQFANMNVSAQPFVPNLQAQPFVPMGYPPAGYPPGMQGEWKSMGESLHRVCECEAAYYSTIKKFLLLVQVEGACMVLQWGWGCISPCNQVSQLMFLLGWYSDLT